MSYAADSWLLPGTILDADIIRQLCDFHKFENVTFERFVKIIHKESADDLRKSLKPFLKQIPSLSSIDGKTANKPQSKAAVLLFQRHDVKVLREHFGQAYGSLKAFKQFIQEGDPDHVANLFKTAAASEEISRFSDRLQCILKNRVSLLKPASTAVQTIEEAVAVNTHGGLPVSQHDVDISPIEDVLKSLHGSDHQNVISVYKKAIRKGKSQRKAFKKAARAAQRLLPHKDEAATAREAYPSPCSPEIQENPSLVPAEIAVSDFRLETNATVETPEARKRKRSFEDDLLTEELALQAGKRRSGSEVELDGREAMLKRPDAPARHHAISRDMITQSPTGSEDHHAPHTLPHAGHATTTSPPRGNITDLEQQLLLDTLQSTARKSVRGDDSSNEIAKAQDLKSSGHLGSKNDPVLKHSTPRTVVSRGNPLDDLLHECLSSTARKSSNGSQTTSSANKIHEEPVKAAIVHSPDINPSPPMATPTKKVSRSSKKPIRSFEEPAPFDKPVARATPEANKGKPPPTSVNRQQLEDSLLRECLTMTAKKKVVPIPAVPANALDGTAEGLEAVHSPRAKSLELAFSPPAKHTRKRKRIAEPSHSPGRSGEMFEVEESDLDEDGNRRLEQPLSIKRRKLRPSRMARSPSRKSSSSEDYQSLLDAQLQEPTRAAAQLAGLSKGGSVMRPFHSPMNCDL